MDAAPTPHGPIWHGATVLVVDDEPSLRQVVRRTLAISRTSHPRLCRLPAPGKARENP
jgi:hypothetical protein